MLQHVDNARMKRITSVMFGCGEELMIILRAARI